MSQQALGAACGVRFQQIQKYECAANRISAVMLWRIANALGVEVGYFYEGSPGFGDGDLATPAGRPPSSAGDMETGPVGAG